MKQEFYCLEPGVMVYQVSWPCGAVESVTLVHNRTEYAFTDEETVLNYASRLMFALHGNTPRYRDFCTKYLAVYGNSTATWVHYLTTAARQGAT